MGAQNSHVPIFVMMAKRQEKETLALLRSGESVNQRTKRGYSIMRLALEQGMEGVFEFCYKAHAALLPPLGGGKTILHRAIELGHGGVCKLILKRCISLKNVKDQQGRTPLHVAVISQDPEMVALLLKFNADPHVLDCEFKSPSDYALGMVSDEIVEQLSVEDWLAKRLELTKSTFLSSLEGKSMSLEITEQALHACNIPVISDFAFCDVLSSGSSCSVVRARWRGSEVAIKLFRNELTLNDLELSKFVREAQVLASLRHPNVIMLMGGVVDQQFGLVFEFMPHGSLFQAIYAFKVPDKLRACLQIATALAYLHSSSPPIVHRDLKPENCLLDKANNVKLADFGLACHPGASQEGGCLGTFRFMAPELFGDEPALTTAVDVWAFGCTVLEIFAQERPWSFIPSDKPKLILDQLFNKQPLRIPQTVPPSIKELIQECCKYNPKRRPHISEVLDRLQKLYINNSQYM